MLACFLCFLPVTPTLDKVFTDIGPVGSNWGEMGWEVSRGEKTPNIEIGGGGGAPYQVGAEAVSPTKGVVGRSQGQQGVVGVAVGGLPAPWSWRPHRHLRRC